MFLFLILFLQSITILSGTFILTDNKWSLKLFLLMAFMGQGIGYPLYLLIGTNGVFAVIFFFIAFLWFRTKKVLSNLIASFFVLIFLVLASYYFQWMSTIFLGQPLEILATNQIFNVMTTVVPVILTIAFCGLIRYVFINWKIHRLMKKRYNVTIVSFLTLTVFIIYLNIYFEAQQEFMTKTLRTNSILFMFYSFVLLGVFFSLTRIESRSIQMENERIQNKQLRKYAEALEVQYEEIRKFRHDYVNMLLTMTEYLNQENLDGLKDYFSKNIAPIGEKFQSNENQLAVLSNLKVIEIKGIVSTKLIKAQALNIHTSVEVEKNIIDLHMDIMKLCRGLGIILDNAIEEATLCERPSIEIAFLETGMEHRIIVRNSCREEVPAIHQIYQKGFSTKGEKRGLGLSNLREIVSEYDHVTLDTYIEDGYFVQEIAIDYYSQQNI